MAEQAGSDLLLRILAGQERIEAALVSSHARLAAHDGHFERLMTVLEGITSKLAANDARLDRATDATMLVASVVHRMTETLGQRLDDHEARITALEESR